MISSVPSIFEDSEELRKHCRKQSQNSHFLTRFSNSFPTDINDKNAEVRLQNALFASIANEPMRVCDKFSKGGRGHGGHSMRTLPTVKAPALDQLLKDAYQNYRRKYSDLLNKSNTTTDSLNSPPEPRVEPTTKGNPQPFRLSIELQN